MAPRSSQISGFNARLNLKYFMGDNKALYGVEVLGFRTDFSFFNEQVANTSNNRTHQ
ncbi:MAG: hypothetical protein IPP83_12580 [Flavobacteriales bacterium]|nr:hypothetical protein [Flavobacteriales bacterium]